LAVRETARRSFLNTGVISSAWVFCPNIGGALARPMRKQGASRHEMLPPSAKRLAARRNHLAWDRRTAMNTLMITDLAVTEELDRKTMRAVRGGLTAGSPMPLFPSLSQFKFGDGTTVSASQLINQGLSIDNINGMDTAFATGVSSTITPHQSANNSITLI